MKDEDFDKPFIAICNSFIEIIPGHKHLNEFGKLVKEAVRAAGMVPFEFNTIGVDDGIAMGHIGMRYSLPSREIIADSVETVVNAHWFDGMICIPNCDKITPGMMMVHYVLIFRLCLFQAAQWQQEKHLKEKLLITSSVFEGVGAYQSGKISEEELKDIEDRGCPSCGSCSGMFTANSMNCLCEVLGLALPGNGSILAIDPRREELIKAREKLKILIERDIKPRDIVTEEAIDDAFALDMAMGGSTNTVLHTLALAQEAGLDYDMNRIDAVSRRVPHLCKVSPASNWHMEDIDVRAGLVQF